MAEFPSPGVGAEPAAAPVGEVIDRRKQPRLPAELLCVLFRIAILVQQGNTASVQPEQPLLLIPWAMPMYWTVSGGRLLWYRKIGFSLQSRWTAHRPQMGKERSRPFFGPRVIRPVNSPT